jgi:hypothetical protein
MKGKIIPRTAYEVYFIEAEKKRPGRQEIRKALRSLHPFYSSTNSFYGCSCMIANKRFEMVTVFAHPRTISERVFSPHLRTQTQTLVARFAHESPCVIRAPGELLVLKERPESIRLSGHGEEPDKAMKVDRDMAEIIDERSMLRKILLRGTPILAIAAVFPVVFAIACATINQDRGLNAERHESSAEIQTASAPIPEPAHEKRDFFSCLKEDIEAVNECAGVILSYRYDCQKQATTSMKMYGGKIAKLGERLKKAEGMSGVSIPAVSFGNEFPEYTVFCARADGHEKKAASLDWSKEQTLEASCAKNRVKIKGITLSPFAECSLGMEPQALGSCISLLGDFCDRESIDIKTCTIDSGKEFSVSVSFADTDETRKKNVPDADSIQRAFRRPVKDAEKTKPKGNTVIGKISEDGKKTVTFRKNDMGKISTEGGLK